MADNLVVKTDPAGNMKPDKQHSQEKIDGLVALVMALDRLSRHVDQVADDPELLVV
jgi:phage terminase large subunit-like protein